MMSWRTNDEVSNVSLREPISEEERQHDAHIKRRHSPKKDKPPPPPDMASGQTNDEARKKEIASKLHGQFTIITGGAMGTDSLAEQLAREWGMQVKLCLARHHHRVSEKYPAISRTDLETALPRVEISRQRLKRHTTKNPFVRDLLARNWFVVRDAKVVYAYAKFEDRTRTTVEGGAGMTVQMCVDHNRDYPENWKESFVYDESLGRWYEMVGEDSFDPEMDDITFTEAMGRLAFRECFCGPILHPLSAVVGGRTLGEDGRRTLENQFKRTVVEYSRWESMTEASLVAEVEKLRNEMAGMSF